MWIKIWNKESCLPSQTMQDQIQKKGKIKTKTAANQIAKKTFIVIKIS